MTWLARLLAICLIALLLCGRFLALAQDEPDTESAEGETLDLQDNNADIEEEGGELDLGSAEVIGTRSLLDVLSDTRALTILPAESFEGAASVPAGDDGQLRQRLRPPQRCAPSMATPLRHAPQGSLRLLP